MQENKKTDFIYCEGIKFYPKYLEVTTAIDYENKCITIMPKYSKAEPTIHIKFEQLIDCETVTNEMITEKGKSVIGRAIVGGILTGGIGAVVGGMSGIGSKKKVKKTYYFAINYKSLNDNEIKVLSFRMDLGITMDFRNTLKNIIIQNNHMSSEAMETYL